MGKVVCEHLCVCVCTQGWFISIGCLSAPCPQPLVHYFLPYPAVQCFTRASEKALIFILLMERGEVWSQSVAKRNLAALFRGLVGFWGLSGADPTVGHLGQVWA